METGLNVRLRKDGVSKARVAGCVLLSVMLGWALGGCGGTPTAINWPEGTGYLSGQNNRPSSAHNIRSSTKAQIVAVGEGRIRLGPDSKLELKDSRPLLFAPGAEVSYLAGSPEKFEFKDFNGDSCVLVTGLTVRVSDYGQMVPIRFRPEEGVAPPTGPPSGEIKTVKGGTHTDRTGMTVFSGVIGGEQYVNMNEL